MQRHYIKELFSNQFWQGLNFLSKAAFLLILTPYMLEAWGKDEYGVFGLASSLIVSMAIIDGGIRDATRIRLCNFIAKNDDRGFAVAWLQGLVSFSLIAAVVSVGAFIIAWHGELGVWLQIPPEDNWVIATTVLLTALLMLSFLALEPLAARNELSKVKISNTIGAFLALPCVWIVVHYKGTVLAAMLTYFACMITPNLILIFTSRIHRLFSWELLGQMRFGDLLNTYKNSWWLYFSTLVSILRTHALTFFISHISGPAVCGVFYIYLRISELVSTIGGTSSETLVASMGGTANPSEKTTRFHQALRYGLIFCIYGAMTVCFAGTFGLDHFFRENLDVTLMTTATMAMLGMSNSFIYFIYHASMGVNKVRLASLCNGASAIFACAGCFLLQSKFGLEGTMLASAASALCMIPAAKAISTQLGDGFGNTWIKPLFENFKLWGTATLCLAIGYMSKNEFSLIATLVVAFGLFILQWKREHSHPRHAESSASGELPPQN